MLVNRVILKSFGNAPPPMAGYEWAVDSDFSGTANGSFKYIGTKEYIAIPDVIKGVNVTSYASMFQNNTVIKGVMSTNSNITDMSDMFRSITTTTLDLSVFDTSSVTIMPRMFTSASSLITLDLTSFKTENLTNIGSLFSSCSSLTTLDLSSFDTSKVTSTSSMFYQCSKLTTVYARTESDITKLKSSSNRPSNVVITLKPTG